MPKIVRFLSGGFEGDEAKAKEDLSSVDKPCMLVYCGKFESMDGPVEIKDEDIEQLAANHNGFLAKLSRLANGETHPKHNPPVQLDHSTSARDTVGRLVGNLTVGEHTDSEGNKVKALMGTARILGKENVERVMDGRWTNLSGGFDLETHKVSELTITPFPAAADASMLSARLASYKGHEIETEDAGNGGCIAVVDGEQLPGKYMSKSGAIMAAKKFIDENSEDTDFSAKLKAAAKLSSGEDSMPSYKELKERMSTYEKCKKHLMDEKKMSEEDADKHLEAAKDEELTAMSAAEDEREKKMSDEKAAKDKEDAEKKESELKRMSALTEQKTQFVALSKGFRAKVTTVQLTAKKAKINARLSALQAETKITPAERKALNLDELAGKSDEAVEAALSSYAKREPVIDTGLYGSTKALTAAQLSRKVKGIGAEATELKTRLNMASKRPEALARLKELGLTEGDLDKGAQIQPHAEEQGAHDVDMEAAYATMKQLMSEGKEEEAKQHFMKHMSGAPAQAAVTPDQTAEMSSLAEEVKNLHAGLDEIVKLAAPVFGATAEELA